MNCSSLRKKPKLPTENLEIRCYENMFTGCDKLSEWKSYKNRERRFDAPYFYLFETQQYCDNFEQYEDKLIFSLDFCDSFERKLVLHTSKKFFLEKYDILGFTDAQIIKNNNDFMIK